MAYKDQGDLQNAALVANQLIILLQKNNPNSADLKAVQKYFNDLKDQIATNTKAAEEAAAATQQTIEQVLFGSLSFLLS